MQIGMFLTAQFHPGGDGVAEARAVVEQARLAERLGFASIFLGHHYLAKSAFLQPLPLLARLSGETTSIKLGLGVYLSSLAHPVALAEELATIDVLSNGRLIAGLGSGYREIEYAAVGVPYTERFRRLEESITVMRALWSGEAVTMSGLFGRLEGAKLNLKPVQSGGPPIWMGAFGPKGVARAARLGASWLIPPDGDRETLRAKFDDYRQRLAEHDQPLDRDYPLLREVVVAPTHEDAERIAREHLVPLYRQYKNWDAAREVSVADLISRHAVIGDADAVGEQLAWYRDEVGATSVIARLAWPGMARAAIERSMQLLGETVAPRLKG